MRSYTAGHWRLWLGFSLIILGILITLLGRNLDIPLTFIALALLTTSVGLIQLSIWSKFRQCWL